MMLRTIAALPMQPLFLGVRKRPIASCFGGGGSFGIGFGMGVVAGLMDAGIPVEQGPMLGTSAGAWTAAAVAAGVTHDDLLGLSDSYEATDEPMNVIDLTRAVFGEHRDDRVSSVVLELPLGLRKILSGELHSLADVVAASSSPPKFASPHKIGGRKYIDAGILRSTSVDRAESARVLVVVAPIAGGVLGAIGRVYEQVTRAEIHHWRVKSAGGDVLYIRPTREITALIGARGLDGILDPDVGARVYETSYALGLQRGEEFLTHNRRAAGELEELVAA
jgi:predicted acylesterase/phospholipase RssA